MPALEGCRPPGGVCAGPGRVQAARRGLCRPWKGLGGFRPPGRVCAIPWEGTGLFRPVPWHEIVFWREMFSENRGKLTVKNKVRIISNVTIFNIYLTNYGPTAAK